ncbi:hypothetical protein IQ07DRAFT_186863 [Pyrenochaeta sp. DS3sAY3a]|nr:hypothetical protein IQ07DRAFT_186863 [Pyrenochaeta sp. DS3sAY3a]
MQLLDEPTFNEVLIYLEIRVTSRHHPSIIPHISSAQRTRTTPETLSLAPPQPARPNDSQRAAAIKSPSQALDPRLPPRRTVSAHEKKSPATNRAAAKTLQSLPS